MQVTPEERAALERLRKFDTLDHLDDSMLPELTTAAALALRLVREDDGEAITEEWLRSIGWEPMNQDHPVHYYSRKVPLVMWDRRDGLLAVGNSATGWHSIADKDATRGQLRRLASALGIELKEPS